MKLLKFLMYLVLSFVTVGPASGRCKGKCEERASFSVVKIWQSYSKEDQCCRCAIKVDDDKWKEGVQGYFDGCKRATSRYRGKAHDLAATIMESFQVYLTKLMYFSNSNSTILSSSSKGILEAMSRLNKLDQSSMQVLDEVEKAFPEVVNDLNIIASKLSGHIGHLSSSFMDAVGDFSCVYFKYLSNVLLNYRLFGCKREVDFVPTLKQLQKLMNTVALIAETLLNECETSIEVQEAVMVLSLIFWWYTIAVQGMSCAVQDVMFGAKCVISQPIKASSVSLDYVLVSIAQAVRVVVLPFIITIKEMLNVFVNITMALNTAVKDILGLFEGVAITVGDITRNLFKSVNITPATKGLTNIVKGVLFK